MLSVIIPAHNEEQYLLPTLQSLRKQSYADFEVIVVCDGCTDKTPQLANKYAEKVLILKERQGPAAARNAGARLALGETLVFLDADTHPSPDVLTFIAKQTDVIGTCKITPDPPKIKHKIMMGLKNVLMCPFGVSNGIIFTPKKLFTAVGGFGAFQKGEDGHFIRKVKKSGTKFVLLSTPVLNSMRRIEQKGYFGVWTYWIQHPFTKGEQPYEVIR